MDITNINLSETPTFFTAVQISRPKPVYLESSPLIKESPINQFKVAKLVLKPKPVQSKARITNNKNNQKQKESQISVLPVQPFANLFTNDQNKIDDSDQLMKKQDIELERAKIPRAVVKEKKTLNLQQAQKQQLQAPVQSPVVNKSKMDEGARSEARKFMKKQREKRKMEVKKEIDKSFVIKQRLEELQKHTKDALAKKQPTKSPLKPSPPLNSSYYSLSNNKMKEIKVLRLKPMTSNDINEKAQEVDEIPIESTINIPKSPDKQATPKNQANVVPIKKISSNPQDSPIHMELKRQPSTRPSSSKENKKSDNNDDLRLKVPDVKLSMFNTSTKQILNRSDISTANNQTFVKPLTNNIPIWLQNSIIQPYPYNFIWAVRKKLESYTTQQRNNSTTYKNKQHYDLETPQIIKKNKKSAKARRLDHNMILEDGNDSDTNAKSEEIDLRSEANTISEISSIKSDIVHEKSQSVGKQSNVKTSNNDDDYETTISESIFHTISDDQFVGKKRESVNSEFDRASFDKRLQDIGPENVSPNTSEKQNNFLSSTLKNSHESKNDETLFKKPEAPLRTNNSSKAEINDLDNNNKENEQKEEEFKKMLLAFNKSLSHVVEVNHLLSAALISKSSPSSSSHDSKSIASSHKSFTETQIKSIESSTKKDSIHDNYSSSFEKNIESSEKTSNISEMIENMIQADTKQQHQHQKSNIIDDNSDQNSSIRTLIADSIKMDEPIEDPPIVYHSEQLQELTSSTTKITITRTDNNRQELSNNSRKNQLENTFNESKLINMFRLSESEVSFIESVTDQPSAANIFIKSTSEIKSWERSLIERTRGQIAWLELQKLNFKKHGHADKVSAIKKQQRAILLRLEKERIKMREENSEKSIIKSDNLIDHAVAQLETSMDVTGNESDAKECIERILQQREQNIKQRRKKIEHLVNWQRRLDDEEKKLKLLERELLNANKSKSMKSPRKKSSSHDILNTSFELVKSIDKSLTVLDNDVIVREDEKVDMLGSKMNKLWYRLTGLLQDKFQPNEIYHFTKKEIAKFYEDAKEAVLESDLKIFLETSAVAQQQEIMNVHNEEERKTFSRSDTMNSIANIETEEEYPNSCTNEQTETQSENDNELQDLMANQMKVFVDQKRVTEQVKDENFALSLNTHVNDKTFQVQNVAKDESQSHDDNKIIENISIAEIDELEMVEEESQIINTEPIESNDFSEAFEEYSTVPDTQSSSNIIQITDMDQEEDDNIQMIENISFPNLEISLNDTIQNDFDNDRMHDLSTITECTEYEQGSSGPISSEIITHGSSSTPTTSERLNSEIQQRLLSINDSLEQVEEAFRRVPLMGTNSVTYSTDKDFDFENVTSAGEEEKNSKSDLAISPSTTESGSQIATSTPKTLMPDIISDAESLK